MQHFFFFSRISVINIIHGSVINKSFKNFSVDFNVLRNNLLDQDSTTSFLLSVADPFYFDSEPTPTKILFSHLFPLKIKFFKK